MTALRDACLEQAERHIALARDAADHGHPDADRHHRAQAGRLRVRAASADRPLVLAAAAAEDHADS